MRLFFHVENTHLYTAHVQGLHVFTSLLAAILVFSFCCFFQHHMKIMRVYVCVAFNTSLTRMMQTSSSVITSHYICMHILIAPQVGLLACGLRWVNDPILHQKWGVLQCKQHSILGLRSTIMS